MNKAITENWNSVVGHDDTVYIMGDFGRPASAYAHRLNGHKVLILGNHDKKSQCAGHFEEIHDELTIEIGGQKVLLHHHPWRHMVGPHDNKFIKDMPNIEDHPDKWLISGHVHNSKPKLNLENKNINISCEHWNFTPASEDEISKIIKSII